MMARIFTTVVLLMSLLALLFGTATAATVHVVPLVGPIGPATSDLVERSIDDAAEDGAHLVVLKLDTPGGLDTSMRLIVRAIIESPLPIVAYVTPSGARAASAGTFILYASHIAAMAPGTNLGAATPVALSGGSASGSQEEAGQNGAGETVPSTAERRSASESKAVEDAAAYLRSLAEMRGRDPEFAEAAVREAKSLTYREALASGVIDLVAEDLDDLLSSIDGREVALVSGPFVISSADAELYTIELDWRYQLLSIITNPNVAAILMLIGVYGIILEFYSPGLVGPGLVGAICLLLGLYAFQVLPVSYAGVALIILGIVLIVSEALLPSFGILGVSGVVAFIAGSVLFMETEAPGFGILPYIIGALALSVSGLFVVTLSLIFRSQERPVATGAEAVVHGNGEVVSWHPASGAKGRGRIRVEGELWHAEGPKDLRPGARVTVRSRDGLTLIVGSEQKESE
jgi:membrane-bound serine protease (ClpP class)